MDKSASRIAKLRELVSSVGGPTEFAKKYSQRWADKPIDSTFVSQILNGHRGFGEKAAANMERRAGLPAGYFDSTIEHQDAASVLTHQQRALLDLFNGLTDRQREEEVRRLQTQKQQNDDLLTELLKRRA